MFLIQVGSESTEIIFKGKHWEKTYTKLKNTVKIGLLNKNMVFDEINGQYPLPIQGLQ